jgi:hypothetical protein
VRSLHAASLRFGAATGPAPWKLQAQPAATARDAGAPPGRALVPVLKGLAAGGADWAPVAFREQPRAPRGALPGALLPGRPLLAEQLLRAGTGDLGEHLWLVRLADQLLEVRGLGEPGGPGGRGQS